MTTHDASKVDVSNNTVIFNKLEQGIRTKIIVDPKLDVAAELKKIILENITVDEIMAICKRVYGSKAKTEDSTKLP